MAGYKRITLCIITALFVLVMLSLSACTLLGQQKGAAQVPIIVARPTLLTFNINLNDKSTWEQSFTVSNGGGGVLSWAMSDNARWLTLQRASNAADVAGSVKVVVDPTGMTAGSYTGIVTISAEGAANTPVYLPVNLNIPASANIQQGTIPVPPVQQKPASTPNSSYILWDNQNDYYKYASSNVCIVSGSITNAHSSWNLADVSIAAKSGASVDIAKTIPPGEAVIYYKFIPCFQAQDVSLKYTWQAP